MYNCHSRKSNKEYWRCHNYSKKLQQERCRSRCVLENGKLKGLSGGPHNHPPHTDKITKMIVRNRLTGQNAGSLLQRIKVDRSTEYATAETTTTSAAVARHHTHHYQITQQTQDEEEEFINASEAQEQETRQPLISHQTIMFIHK